MKMTKPGIIVIATLLLLCPVAAAGEEVDVTVPGGGTEFVLDGSEVFVVTGEERLRLDLPAGALAIHLVADRLYVALGEHGAVVFDVSDPAAARMERRIPVSHGAVTGFHVVDDDLWMTVDATTAVLGATGIPGRARWRPRVIYLSPGSSPDRMSLVLSSWSWPGSI